MRVTTRSIQTSRRYWTGRVVTLMAAALSLASEAAMISVDGSGKVTGITGLVVGTQIYSVEFKLGTFDSVFGSEDSFDFADSTSAQEAREAIRSTLNAAGSPFLAQTNPTTNLDATGWAFSIPYEITGINPPLRSAAAGFSAALAQNKYSTTAVWADYDNVVATPPSRVWADLTASPVPEPATSVLFASGIIAFLVVVRNRRRFRSARH
ncbi:MAG: PEP-CTERM sorting domain-containing protein [Burkholderiales bacterium]|nr:PEP-CTERM sorting domain-containing protein [Burkholderiales bacterium]